VLIDPSPLAVYQDRIRREVLEGKPVAANTMNEPRTPDTPPYSRGTYTPVEGEQLRVQYDLGPLLSRHIYRGSSPPYQVSTWA
jgi:hypothetical protein